MGVSADLIKRYMTGRYGPNNPSAAHEERGENVHPKYCTDRNGCSDVLCIHCGRRVCAYYPFFCVCRCVNLVTRLYDSKPVVIRCGSTIEDCDCTNSTAEPAKVL